MNPLYEDYDPLDTMLELTGEDDYEARLNQKLKLAVAGQKVWFGVGILVGIFAPQILRWLLSW